MWIFKYMQKKDSLKVIINGWFSFLDAHGFGWLHSCRTVSMKRTVCWASSQFLQTKPWKIKSSDFFNSFSRTLLISCSCVLCRTSHWVFPMKTSFWLQLSSLSLPLSSLLAISQTRGRPVLFLLHFFLFVFHDGRWLQRSVVAFLPPPTSPSKTVSGV